MRATQSDYIIRLIEQLGAALRRLREKLAGGAPAAAEEVLREAADAQAELFGPLWEVIHHLDSRTAAALVPEKERVSGWIELLTVEAEAARLTGDELRERESLRRAGELRAELEIRRAEESRLHY